MRQPRTQCVGYESSEALAGLELGKDIGVRRDSLAERLDMLARWECELRDP